MKTAILVIAVVIAAANCAYSQERPPHDPIGENFFPPELLAENQKALSLTEEQKTSIKGEIQKAQAKFNDLDWQLKSEVSSMQEILKPNHVEEQLAIAQLEKVMALEREIKKTQVTLMVRIKNSLSPEQQTVLRKIREYRGDRDREKQEGMNEQH